jgi:hypothetical protein
MRSSHRKRFVEYLCCLLVINLLVAPVTHASLIMPAEGPGQDSAANQPHCKQIAAVNIESAAMQLELNENGDGQPQCDHAETCKLLCSVALLTR